MQARVFKISDYSTQLAIKNVICQSILSDQHLIKRHVTALLPLELTFASSQCRPVGVVECLDGI